MPGITGLTLEDRVERLRQFFRSWVSHSEAPAVISLVRSILDDKECYVSSSTRLCTNVFMTQPDRYQLVAPWLVMKERTRNRILANHKKMREAAATQSSS